MTKEPLKNQKGDGANQSCESEGRFQPTNEQRSRHPQHPGIRDAPPEAYTGGGYIFIGGVSAAQARHVREVQEGANGSPENPNTANVRDASPETGRQGGDHPRQRPRKRS